MYRMLMLLTIAICFLVFILNFSKVMPEFPSAEFNFRFYCAQCHGLDAKGGGVNAIRHLPVAPRDLTDSKAMGKLSDDEILEVIRNGGIAPARSTLMPPFKNTIQEIEILYLKEYIRELCDC
ncbi:MAG: cytochrome c [Thermodesulfobacteriota bacterium]